MRLTIVIPTYNEADNLPDLISVLFALPLRDLSVLVVDDDSPDGTGQVADSLAATWSGRLEVIHRPGKLGLGSAYLQGFTLALQQGAQAVGQMDADFSHPPEMIPPMLDRLESYDLVMGSRYIPGGGVDQHWPAWRKFLSSFGNVYARTILRLPVRDVTGGFRLWRAERLSHMPLEQVRSNGYAFQVEMVCLAHKLAFRINEEPFYFHDRYQGRSKMSFPIQVEAALGVWRMLRAYRNLKPDG